MPNPDGKKTEDVLRERVMKLELATLLLVNTLRFLDVPQELLDKVEKIVTSGDAQCK